MEQNAIFSSRWWCHTMQKQGVFTCLLNALPWKPRFPTWTNLYKSTLVRTKKIAKKSFFRLNFEVLLINRSLWNFTCLLQFYYIEIPGGYDWYPCQHERFIRQKSGQWINNVTYCAGKEDKCVSDMIVTIANVSLPSPGVVRHDYTDALLAPQVCQDCISCSIVPLKVRCRTMLF